MSASTTKQVQPRQRNLLLLLLSGACLAAFLAFLAWVAWTARW